MTAIKTKIIIFLYIWYLRALFSFFFSHLNYDIKAFFLSSSISSSIHSFLARVVQSYFSPIQQIYLLSVINLKMSCRKQFVSRKAFPSNGTIYILKSCSFRGLTKLHFITFSFSRYHESLTSRCVFYSLP